MTDYIHELKIPLERVAVLIGKSGEVKAQLEEHTRTKIQVDSDEGDILIMGEDTVNVYTTKEIVRAIGRGFNPNVATLLLKQEYTFEIIDLRDYARETNHLIRLRGRVIGGDGRARRTLESLTDTHICVYGKTIGIIGETEMAGVCRRAIESLLAGSKHATVYRFLEKNRRQLKDKEVAQRIGTG